MNDHSAFLSALLTAYPAPWRVIYHPPSPYPEDGPAVAAVEDAKGNPLWTLETHTGDGDKVYMGEDDMIALVSLINALAGQ